MAVKSGHAQCESYIAGADLRTKQYFIVEAAAYTATVANAATDNSAGVLLNKPNTNEAAAVAFSGIVPVVSDGSGTAIAAGDLVGPNASGKAVKKTTADFGIIGMAKQASTADGTVIEVDLDRGTKVFRTIAG